MEGHCIKLCATGKGPINFEPSFLNGWKKGTNLVESNTKFLLSVLICLFASVAYLYTALARSIPCLRGAEQLSPCESEKLKEQ